MAGRIAIYYGDVTTPNGISTNGTGAADIFSGYDSCVFVMPGLSGGSKTSATTDAFEIYKQISSFIWIYIPMTDGGSFSDESSAETEIKNRVGNIVQWSKDYLAENVIGGIFLDEFDFESTFANGNYVTRSFQNKIVNFIHNGAGLPVMVNSFNQSDIFTRIGPTYGGEAGNKLDEPSVGSDSNLQDWLVTTKPISNSDVPPNGSVTFNHIRPANILSSLSYYNDQKNVRVASVQLFDYSGISEDSLIGLDTTSALLDRIADYNKLMQMIGADLVGVADSNYATSSNKIIASVQNTLSNSFEPKFPNNYANLIYSENDTYHVINNVRSVEFNDKFEVV